MPSTDDPNTPGSDQASAGATPPADPGAGSQASPQTSDQAFDQASQQLSSPPAAATGPGPVLSVLSDRGYDVSDFDSDEAAIEGLLAAAEDRQTVDPLVQAGRRYQEYQSDFEKWLAERDQQRPPASQPALAEKAKPTFQWDLPEYDASWLQYCDVDQKTGRFVPRVPELAEYARKANAYHDAQRQQGERLLREFPTLTRQVFSDHLAEHDLSVNDLVAVVKEFREFRDSQSQRQANDSYQQWESQHPEFYQRDAKGNAVRDLQTGQVAITPQYEAAVRYAEQFRQDGVSGEALFRMIDIVLERDRLAGRFGDPGKATGAGSSSTSAAEVGQEKKKRFMRRVPGLQTPNRNGTTPNAVNPNLQQNPDETLDDVFDDELRKAGLLPANT